MRKSCIIGCKGQDGQLLGMRLASRGHVVSGVARGDLDLTKAGDVLAYLHEHMPDELYYLAAYQHSSQDAPDLTEADIFTNSFSTNVQGLVSVLDGIRQLSGKSRIFYAASSHVFGTPNISPQNESTSFRPENIYGISKAAAVEACRYYRKNHGLFVACGILYNHESALRSEKFVMKKIISGALRISRQEQEFLTLGNLEAAVDWGHAQNYVDAMIHILSQPSPDDYVIASGKTHTVRELVEIVFDELQLDWKKHVKVEPGILTKPTVTLMGNAAKLRATGWQPVFDFPTMVKSILRDLQGSI